MKKSFQKFILFLILLVTTIFSTGFVFYTTGPDPLRWEGKMPIVRYKVNPNGIGPNIGGESDQIDAIRNAGDVWSFFQGRSHLSFEYSGTTNRAQPYSPNEQECNNEFIKEMFLAQKTVYTSQIPDADCTGESCVFLWSCTAQRHTLHFDIQLNGDEFAFSGGGIQESHEYDLQSVATHAFGHALGLNHCLPGDSQAKCAARMAAGQTDPAVGAVMHKFIQPGTALRTLSNDDRAGLKALYGALNAEESAIQQEIEIFQQRSIAICDPDPCLFPDEETDVSYALSATEASALAEHADLLVEKDLDSEQSQIQYAGTRQNLYNTAWNYTHVPAERHMSKVMDIMTSQIAASSSELLELNREMLVIQLQRRKNLIVNLRQEVSSPYLRFLEAEARVLIQLRREMIDALANR